MCCEEASGCQPLAFKKNQHKSSCKGTQPRAPQPQQAKVGPAGASGLCHMSAARDAGSINSKEVRVNKRDSPRISKEIHIDRKQPLGVSLKGSSLGPDGAVRQQVSRTTEQLLRSSKSKTVPLRWRADRSLKTRLNVPVVRFNEDLSPSDLTK